MDRERITDKTLLRRVAYRTPARLETRLRVHRRYTQPAVDFPQWILDHFPWQGEEVVLDVGCGSGAYVAALLARAGRLVTGDLSAGMLDQVAATWRDRPEGGRIDCLLLDAQALPLADETMDVALANHMLYHVPDQASAISEIARVLRPQGVLLAATNGVDNMKDIQEVWTEAYRRLTGKTVARPRPIALFSLENGQPKLARYFGRVERHDLPSALVLPEAQPALDYLESMHPFYENLLEQPIPWPEMSQALSEFLEERLQRHGHFRVRKLTGVFLCRQPRPAGDSAT